VEFDSDVRYAWSGEIALAYRVVGGAPIDLLYLPGFVSNVQLDWEGPAQGRFLRGLASFSRVISMDRRGWGCSDRLSAGAFPPLETLMEDVGVVMDAAGSERAAVWASGENGLLGLLFAAAHPDRVSGLILYAATPSFVRRDDMPWQPTREELEEERKWSRRWGTRELAREAFAAACPSATDDVGEFEWYVRWLRLSGTPASVIAETDRYIDTDLRRVLPAIHVPTLVLRRRDLPAEIGQPIETARYLASHIPDAELRELPGRDLCHWTGDSDAIVEEVARFLTGRHHVPAHDRMLTTILVTDIVGSTTKAAELGDRAWTELLEAHHRSVRERLVEHRGREIDAAGDGLLATFEGPARAIRCAEAICEAARDLGVEDRVGCHVGEVERSGTAIRGIAVHVAARVASLAGPGEILVSSTVKDLVAGSGIAFVDLGHHDLKGVPDTWRLYRVKDWTERQ
jgi:class 3 adenylate cyclase